MQADIVQLGDFCSINGCIYGPTIQANSWYIYVHRRKTDFGIFYVGLGRYNRCNQVNQRSDYWKKIYKKHNRTVHVLFNNLTKSEAIEKEKELIAFLKKQKTKLCNLTDGGEFIADSLKKKVYMYSMHTGEFVKEFDSISSANCFLNIDCSDPKIGMCLRGKRKSYKGYCFSEIKIDKYVYHKKPIHNIKKVYQYDENGNFINEWPSLSSVNFVKSHTSISNCLNKNLTAYGYFWRTSYANKIVAEKPVPALKIKRKIIMTSDNKIFESIMQAHRDTGYTKKKIQIELKKENGIFKSI